MILNMFEANSGIINLVIRIDLFVKYFNNSFESLWRLIANFSSRTFPNTFY